jgi:hypothetical protein
MTLGTLTTKLKSVKKFSVLNTKELLASAEEFLKQYPFPGHNQLCFLNTKDHKADPDQGTGNRLHPEAKMYGLDEHKFTEFLPDWKHSIFYDIYKNFPMPVTRMRLMRVPPKRTYSMHQDGDNEIRYHIAVKTNPHAYFVYGDTLDLIHVPADGNCYEFDVSRPHSFVNFNPNEERWHLVLNAWIK